MGRGSHYWGSLEKSLFKRIFFQLGLVETTNRRSKSQVTIELSTIKGRNKVGMVQPSIRPRWRFEICFSFHPKNWGDDSVCLIFFKWVLGCLAGSDRNQLVSLFFLPIFTELTTYLCRGYNPFTKYHGHPSSNHQPKQVLCL